MGSEDFFLERGEQLDMAYQQIDELRSENEALKKENDGLRIQDGLRAFLEARVAVLEKQLEIARAALIAIENDQDSYDPMYTQGIKNLATEALAAMKG